MFAVAALLYAKLWVSAAVAIFTARTVVLKGGSLRTWANFLGRAALLFCLALWDAFPRGPIKASLNNYIAMAFCLGVFAGLAYPFLSRHKKIIEQKIIFAAKIVFGIMISLLLILVFLFFANVANAYYVGRKSRYWLLFLMFGLWVGILAFIIATAWFQNFQAWLKERKTLRAASFEKEPQKEPVQGEAILIP